MWYFESINEFINMGGHGFYVWLAYGVCALTLTTFLLSQRRRKHALIKQLRKKIDRNANASAS